MEAKKVFNPSHYGGKDDPYETIKVLEAWLTPDEMIGFCKGNAIKYQTRHRQKGGLEDLSKAAWYQNYLVTYLAQRGHSAYGPNTLPAEKYEPAPKQEAVNGDDALATGHDQSQSLQPNLFDDADAASAEIDNGIAAITATFTQEKAA